MKYLVFTLLALLLVSCGGDKEDSILSISILIPPTGGQGVTAVSCTFDAHLTQGSEPIEVAIEWWWEDAFGLHDQVVSRTFEEYDNTAPSTYTTAYYANPGYVLLNYYWVEFKWQNEDGTYGWITSQKVYCY